MTTQQTPESVRLRIAEFGELSRRVHHRAVVLTELRTVSRKWFNRGRKSLLGQPFRDFVNRGDSRCGRTHAGQETIGTVSSKFCYRCASIALSQKTQSLQRECVVRLLACSTTRTREGEDPARASAPRSRIGAVRGSLRCLDKARLVQCGQGSTDRCCGRSQLVSEGRGCARAVLSQDAGDTLRGLGREFHNNIVS